MIFSRSLRLGSVARMGGSDKDLARAYRHARAIFCSPKYEGFSIPQLEARSSGCVVASSNAGSIPVVVVEAAANIDPTCIDDVRRALEAACFNESTRAQLLSAGPDRVRLFSWDRCARKTCAAYRQVISG